MEFIVEKIGMSRTMTVPSTPVTLLKVLETKVCEIAEDGKSIVAYADGKKNNKTIEGKQSKYFLNLFTVLWYLGCITFLSTTIVAVLEPATATTLPWITLPCDIYYPLTCSSDSSFDFCNIFFNYS